MSHPCYNLGNKHYKTRLEPAYPVAAGDFTNSTRPITTLAGPAIGYRGWGVLLSLSPRLSSMYYYTGVFPPVYDEDNSVI